MGVPYNNCVAFLVIYAKLEGLAFVMTSSIVATHSGYVDSVFFWQQLRQFRFLQIFPSLDLFGTVSSVPVLCPVVKAQCYSSKVAIPHQAELWKYGEKELFIRMILRRVSNFSIPALARRSVVLF